MTPFLRAFDPETAHGLALGGLRIAFPFGAPPPPRPMLSTRLFGLSFPNPIGIAAGFDKDARAVDPALRLGAGFVEVGAVTPRPQKGNPRPRLFRLSEDQAVINRMGFNNAGLDAMARRLQARRAQPGVVGANLGANRDSKDRTEDYVAGLRGLWRLADFFTLNISSPNTEGLRDLQEAQALATLLRRVIEERDALASESATWAPVLVKVAPDLDDEEIDRIAEVVVESGVDGAILTNTTTSRPPSLISRLAREKGGLSGAPLRELSTKVLRRFAKAVDRRVPIIAVGGVDSAEHAYEKFRAGAQLVQLYTALVFQGPGVIARIVEGLESRLREDGLAHLSDVIGADL